MGLCVGSLLWICSPPSRVAPREQRPQGRAQGTRAILNRHLSPAGVAKIFFPLSLPFSAPGSPESSAWRVTAAAAMIFAHSGRRSLRAHRGKTLPALGESGGCPVQPVPPSGREAGAPLDGRHREGTGTSSGPGAAGRHRVRAGWECVFSDGPHWCARERNVAPAPPRAVPPQHQ